MIDCISMWQPWATWVEKEWKKVETRRHERLACLARRAKRIAIFLRISLIFQLANSQERKLKRTKKMKGQKNPISR